MDGKGKARGVFGIILVLGALILCGPGGSFGGDLEPTAGPGEEGTYTLQDVYDRLYTGAAGTLSTATAPSAGPADSRPTVNEIMGKAPSIDDTDGATESDVAEGKTFWGLSSGQWGPRTGSLAAETVENDTVQQGAGIYEAFDLSEIDADLDAGNILEGVSIYGVVGTVLQAAGDAEAGHVLEGRTFSNATEAGGDGAMPDRGAVSITPGTTAQTIVEGYHDGSGTVEGDADLASGNIKSGVEIFGVDGDSNVVDTSSGDAIEGDIAAGKKAWVDGTEITGTASTGGTCIQALVPKTGQTTCYDTDGNTIECTDTGQDGDLQKGIEWPSPRFTDNNDGTVTDNLTKLVWLQEASCYGAQSWADALTYANSLRDGLCYLYDGSSAGDWHLPSVKELYSLIDHGNYSPALPSGHPFNWVASSAYWSSTSRLENPSEAWRVFLNYGAMAYYNKSVGHYVWPVREAQ